MNLHHIFNKQLLWVVHTKLELGVLCVPEKLVKTVLHLCRPILFTKNLLSYRFPKQQMANFVLQGILEVKKLRVLMSLELHKLHKVVVSITNLHLHLVPLLSMHCIHSKYIGECVSRWVIMHAFHDKVLELGASKLLSSLVPKRGETSSCYIFIKKIWK